MAAVEQQNFLSYVDLRYCWPPIDSTAHPLLDLLKNQKYQEVLELVTSGAVSPKDKLNPLDTSILEMSMSPRQNPVLGDIRILLNALKDKGEKLDPEDLYRACCTGAPDLIEMMLSYGAPVGPNALHRVVERFPHGRASADVTEIIKLLLNAKAEVDALGSMGETPLTTACAALSMPKNVLQCLLDLKADPMGAAGKRTPLHAHVSKWGNPAGVELLVKSRADVNHQDASGKTAVHLALAGHPQLNLAICLKEQGADVTLADHKGLRASELLLRRDMPTQAAELEGRELNAQELRLQNAMEHPLAQKFSRSAISSASWTLDRSPEDGYGGFCNNEMREDFPYGDRRLSEDLDRIVPKFFVLQLPLTRYSELFRDVWLKSPEPHGFTVNGLLMEIYKFYQESFSKEELEDISAHFGRGTLGDTFGYIQNNVVQDEEPANKQRRTPRLSLRGDSIFFEGFGSCKYFEDDQTLWGGLSLGS